MSDTSSTNLGAAPPAAGLASPSFLGLLATQWLTAINDNAVRWLVIGIGKQYVAESEWLSVSLVLAIGTYCFVLPYLLLAAPAGYLADRFSKRSVIVGCKIGEIVIVLSTLAAIAMGNVWLLFVVVALMGAQSALFSPAKMGAIPEILPGSKLSSANGVFGLATITATVLGMALGSWLSDATGYKGQEYLGLSAAVLLTLAVVGTSVSLMIERLAPANRERRFPFDAVSQTYRDLRNLASQGALFRVALGLMFFWAVGALATNNIDLFVTQGRIGMGPETDKLPLLFSLVVGVGLGSVLAGVWSAGRVELGILPLGAAGIAVGSISLFAVRGVIIDDVPGITAGFVWACALLFVVGTSAGLFSVPLDAFMQHRSPRKSRGAILAASNFLTNSGMLASSLAFYVLSDPLNQSASAIFFYTGLLTIPVFLYIVFLIPQASIRFFVWLASRTIYRIRIYDRHRLPETGGALLTPNHVSWLDGVLLLLSSSRPIRMVVWGDNFNNPLMKRLANLWGVIPISPTKPKQIVKALATAREALENGELVCIFPEGGISRTGQIQAFKPGMMRILKGVDAPVIPVYLDELWGSIFTFDREKFFWKLPRKWPFPVSIHFGPPLARPADIHEVRQAVQHLGAVAVQRRTQQMTTVVRSFIRQCKRRKFGVKISDSTGVKLTGGQTLMRAIILRRLLRRHVLAEGEQHVGLLLPPTSAGVLANLAVSLDRRVAVNLNYTLKNDVINNCIAACNIKHVVTSRKFMEKMNYELNAEVVCLEDFKDKVTLADKAAGATQAYATPSSVLERAYGLGKIKSDDVLTVIFTSGSTGQPKGVMLTHANIASQVQAIDQVIHLRPSDVLIGILPFFHSLGYTVTLWGAISLDIGGAYHFSPLDSKQVGKLARENRCTVLLSTPTFLRSYLRRCTKEDFEHLDVVVAGAEKLPVELCAAFEEKFGVRPVEGYGATELSPLVSVNVPPSRSTDNFQEDSREGTVGRPVPGVSAKIIDLESDEVLSCGKEGMLWVTGPNVMKGYLNQPEATAEVVKDGWYRTGDVALVDEDGFIKITGRISRFSKIGGEMVPHLKVEEALNEAIGAGEEEVKAVVTSAPDEKKGERLVVVHLRLDQSPQELCAKLQELGLPNLFVPSPDSFIEVDELPVLGSGKLDLKAVQQIAREKLARVSHS